MILAFLFSIQTLAASTPSSVSSTTPTFFSDLENFRQKSLSLQTEKQNLEAASDAYLSSKFFWTPRLSISANQIKSKVNSFPVEDQNYLSADATINLFRAGGDWNTLQSRRYAEKAQALQVENEELRVEMRASDLIFKAIYLHEAQQIQQELLHLKEESLRIATDRFHQGQLPLQEVKKAEVDLTQQKNHARQATLDVLENETNIKSYFVTEITTKDWPFNENLSPKMQSTAKLPTVEQKSFLAESLENNWRSTKAGHWPTLDLTLQYQQFPIKTRADSEWISTLSLTLPIWTQYETSAKVSTAYAQYVSSLNDLKFTEEQTKDQLEFLKQKIEIARVNLVEAKANLDKSKELYQSILRTYRLGRLSTNDLILEQNRLLDSETALISSELSFHQTLVQTCGLIGLRTRECL